LALALIKTKRFFVLINAGAIGSIVGVKNHTSPKEAFFRDTLKSVFHDMLLK